jgi:hypothetical protein
MSILSNIGISSGSKVEAEHVTQLIDAFTGAQEYDILLSGSLTITGSLIFDQITNNISGNASYSNTSSYSLTSLTSNHALTTISAGNQTLILILTHPQINISASTTYYVGNGNITTTGSFDSGYAGSTPAGIICPVKGTIISASISSNCLTTASLGSFTSKITLSINRTGSNFGFDDVLYKPDFYNIKQFTGLNVNAGDRLISRIVTGTGGTLPTGVTHNIQLYIQS